MTVSSTTTKASYNGNGSTTVFAVPFYFLLNADLLVILRSSAGVETTQTLGTNYTATGAGNEAGGSITMTVAPPTGTTLTILRNAAATQETDLLPNDRLPAESLETALDKLTMLVQQLDNDSDRSIKIALTDSSTATTLPSSSSRANKVLGFDSSGNPIAVSYAGSFVGSEEFQTATSGQTVFTLTTMSYNPGSNNLTVFVDGVNQYVGTSYTETNSTTVTFSQGLHLGARVKFSTVQTAASATNDNLQIAGGPRDAIIYWNATSVKTFRYQAVMGGFRYRGQYVNGRSKVFPMPANKVASTSSDLGGMTSVTLENWYAVFACANENDSAATLKIMPFLRARTVVGSTISLGQLKEGMTSLLPQTYAWSSTNNLFDRDILVITENAAFSGRVTKISANTTGSVSVTSIGSIAAGDTLLPSPPGFSYYVYLGSFYMDTAEVRNIFDSGTLVKSKGIFTLAPNTSTGSFPYPTFTDVDCTGYISPLATAVVLDSSCVLSTSSTGFFTEYFGGDAGNHVVQTVAVQKDNATNLTVVFDNVQVPFLYPQKFSYANAGDLSPTRINGQFNITGWIEP